MNKVIVFFTGDGRILRFTKSEGDAETDHAFGRRATWMAEQKEKGTALSPTELAHASKTWYKESFGVA
jgi:hypothetical protein